MLPSRPLDSSGAHPPAENRILQLIQSTQEAGVEVFNFALYPEGHEMVAYNQASPDACVTHFTSEAVWSAGIASGILQEFASQVHPSDLGEISAYIGQHLARAQQGLSDGSSERFSSQRFRGLKTDGSWGWYEIRSRLFRLPYGLVVCEGVFTEVTELMRLLLSDGLTQLSNRMASEQWLAAFCRQQPATPVALINLDLDEFRSINDTFGQAFGDQVILEAATVLMKQAPPGSLVARLEADEFLVALPLASTEGETPADPTTTSLALANQLQLQLQAGFGRGSSLALHLTACCGITVVTSDSGDPRTMLQQANTALWQAKQRGAASVCLYSQAISSAIQARLELKRDLELALATEALRVCYQPQVNRAGQWIGAEVLVRWPQANRDTIGPDVFIPIAEQSGQIRRLGRWVLETACADLSAWIRQGLNPPRLAINLSGVDLEIVEGEPLLHEEVCRICARHNIPLHMLTLELTETALVKDWQGAVQQLQPLVAAGVEVAIDDFGTGYSSLRLLQLLPIHTIKLDKSFIRQLPHSESDRRLVIGSMQIAQQLELQVLAEGVESEAQWQCLQALGCNGYQGYLFSKPLSGEAFSEQLRAAAGPQ